jgi:hypothetical protein
VIQWICANQGFQFVVVTKSMLFRGSRLANIKLLYGYATHPVDAQQAKECLAFLRRENNASIDRCFAFLDDPGNSRAVIYYLMRGASDR